MNKIFNFLLLFVLCLGLSQTAFAQGAAGTDDDGFIVQITSPASIAQDLLNGASCGWEGSVYGPSLTADQAFCAPVVWVHDSLGCSAITNDLTGKIALIRRGTCSFSLKVYNAQKKGALAAIIVNHYTTATDGPCTFGLGAMSGSDSSTAVTIPSIIIHRQTGELIDGALKANQPVNVCFAFPRMISGTAASMYATPLSQVDTMRAISATYNNRSGATQTDVVIKADFYSPSGAHEGSLTYNMPVVEPSADSFVVFPPFYSAPALGKHKVLFTNNKYTESIDSLYAYFEHTNYTFATDNLEVDPGGVGPSNADFTNASFYIQSGGLVFTGATPATATYATFGIANIDSVYVDGDPTANVIGVAVYKADVDGDGAGDLSSSFVDDLSAGLISYQEYVMTGNEENDKLIDVPLVDIQTGQPIELDPFSAYYVSLIYDGTAAGYGRAVRFSNTLDVDYASFTGYPTTPLYFGQLYTGGWSGAIVIERMQLEGYQPGSSKAVEPKTLAASKINITPNPANEYVNLELKLDAVNASVAVTVMDAKGRMVSGTQTEKNFQNGTMNFDVKNLPSGVYYLWVRTAEGSAMKQVAICH